MDGRRKKEESFLKLAIPNSQFPTINSQFPIRKTNRARTARPIYQQLANNYLLAELNFNHAVLFRFRFGQIQVQNSIFVLSFYAVILNPRG